MLESEQINSSPPGSTLKQDEDCVALVSPSVGSPITLLEAIVTSPHSLAIHDDEEEEDGSPVEMNDISIFGPPPPNEESNATILTPSDTPTPTPTTPPPKSQGKERASKRRSSSRPVPGLVELDRASSNPNMMGKATSWRALPTSKKSKKTSALKSEIADLKQQLQDANRVVRAVLGEQGDLVDGKASLRAIRQLAYLRTDNVTLKNDLATSEKERQQLKTQWNHICSVRDQQTVLISSLMEELAMYRSARSKVTQDKGITKTVKPSLEPDVHTDTVNVKYEMEMEMYRMQEELAHCASYDINDTTYASPDARQDAEDLHRLLQIANSQMEEDAFDHSPIMAGPEGVNHSTPGKEGSTEEVSQDQLVDDKAEVLVHGNNNDDDDDDESLPVNRKLEDVYDEQESNADEILDFYRQVESNDVQSEQVEQRTVEQEAFLSILPRLAKRIIKLDSELQERDARVVQLEQERQEYEKQLQEKEAALRRSSRIPTRPNRPRDQQADENGNDDVVICGNMEDFPRTINDADDRSRQTDNRTVEQEVFVSTLPRLAKRILKLDRELKDRDHRIAELSLELQSNVNQLYERETALQALGLQLAMQSHSVSRLTDDSESTRAARSVSSSYQNSRVREFLKIADLDTVIEQNQDLTRQLQTEKQTAFTKMKVLTELLAKSTAVVDRVIAELEATRAKRRALEAQNMKFRIELDSSYATFETDREDHCPSVTARNHLRVEGDANKSTEQVELPEGKEKDDRIIDRGNDTLTASMSDSDRSALSGDIVQHDNSMDFDKQVYGNGTRLMQQQEYQSLLDTVDELQSELKQYQVMVDELEQDRKFYIAKSFETSQLFSIETAGEATRKLHEKVVQCADLRTQLTKLSSELEETKRLKEKLEKAREVNLAEVAELSLMLETRATNSEAELDATANVGKTVEPLHAKSVSELERERKILAIKATDLSIELADNRAKMDDLLEQLAHEQRINVVQGSLLSAQKDALSRRVQDEATDRDLEAIHKDEHKDHDLPPVEPQAVTEDADRKRTPPIRFFPFRRHSRKASEEGIDKRVQFQEVETTGSQRNIDDTTIARTDTQTDLQSSLHVERIDADAAAGMQSSDFYEGDDGIAVDETMEGRILTTKEAEEMTIQCLMKSVEALEDKKTNFSMKFASVPETNTGIRHGGSCIQFHETVTLEPSTPQPIWFV